MKRGARLTDGVFEGIILSPKELEWYHRRVKVENDKLTADELELFFDRVENDKVENDKFLAAVSEKAKNDAAAAVSQKAKNDAAAAGVSE